MGKKEKYKLVSNFTTGKTKTTMKESESRIVYTHCLITFYMKVYILEVNRIQVLNQ